MCILISRKCNYPEKTQVSRSFYYWHTCSENHCSCQSTGWLHLRWQIKAYSCKQGYPLRVRTKYSKSRTLQTLSGRRHSDVPSQKSERKRQQKTKTGLMNQICNCQTNTQVTYCSSLTCLQNSSTGLTATRDIQHCKTLYSAKARNHKNIYC